MTENTLKAQLVEKQSESTLANAECDRESAESIQLGEKAKKLPEGSTERTKLLRQANEAAERAQAAQERKREADRQAQEILNRIRLEKAQVGAKEVENALQQKADERDFGFWVFPSESDIAEDALEALQGSSAAGMETALAGDVDGAQLDTQDGDCKFNIKKNLYTVVELDELKNVLGNYVQKIMKEYVTYVGKKEIRVIGPEGRQTFVLGNDDQNCNGSVTNFIFGANTENTLLFKTENCLGGLLEIAAPLKVEITAGATLEVFRGAKFENSKGPTFRLFPEGIGKGKRWIEKVDDSIVKASHVIVVGDSQTSRAKTYSLDAGEVSLMGGEVKITGRKNTDIGAPIILLDAEKEITVKAKGDVLIKGKKVKVPCFLDHPCLKAKP